MNLAFCDVLIVGSADIKRHVAAQIVSICLTKNKDYFSGPLGSIHTRLFVSYLPVWITFDYVLYISNFHIVYVLLFIVP